MSITATKAVWQHSKATGNARLVLLALAECVNEQRIKAGYPWEAWPSQSTVARMCGCSRSTVQLAFERLAEQREIADTGERKRRGTVNWEVFPDLDLTDSESGRQDMTDSRSGEQGDEDDLTDSRIDLTDSRIDLTDSGDDLTDGSVTNQKEPEEEEPEYEHRSVSPSAATDFSSSPSSPPNSNGNNQQQHVGEGDEKPPAIAQAEAEERRRLLADLEADLKRKPKDKLTLRAVEAVKSELAEAAA